MEDNPSNKQLQVDYMRTFTSESGKRVLGHLKKKTVDQPVYSARGDGAAQSLQMARRSAENELFQYITRMINKGKTNE